MFPFLKRLERYPYEEYHGDLLAPLTKRLQFGRFELSVQASATHYCTPRINNPDPAKYYEYELALYEDGNWLNPRDDDRFVDLRIGEYWEPDAMGVGGYVPVYVVQEIVNKLEELSKED